jgi:hypothetical protein
VKRLQIMIDEDLDADLERLAEKEGTSKAAFDPSLRPRAGSTTVGDPARAVVANGRRRRLRGGGHRRRRLPVILVATSYWVALRNRRDPHHEQATELLVRNGDKALPTSDRVRCEAWTFLPRRAGHRSAVDFLDLLDRSPRPPSSPRECRCAGTPRAEAGRYPPARSRAR